MHRTPRCDILLFLFHFFVISFLCYFISSFTFVELFVFFLAAGKFPWCLGLKATLSLKSLWTKRTVRNIRTIKKCILNLTPVPRGCSWKLAFFDYRQAGYLTFPGCPTSMWTGPKIRQYIQSKQPASTGFFSGRNIFRWTNKKVRAPREKQKNACKILGFLVFLRIYT